MKNTFICGLAALGLLISGSNSGFAQNGERVYLRDLPEPVKKTIRAQQRGDDVRRIEKTTRDGRSVYEVLLDRSGANKTFYVAENGSVVSAAVAKATTEGADSQLANLPKPVQQTFKREAGSAKISDIDKNSVRGETVYEIEFTRDGRSEEISINEDGSLARTRLTNQERDKRGSSAATESSNEDAQAGFDRPLAATRKVDFEDLPNAVKRAARGQAGSNRIEDAERGTMDGKIIYEIAFKKGGEHNEVRIAEDGSIVNRVSGSNIRLPGALSVEEVPARVRSAIRDQVGSGEVNDIDKKTLDGKTVYEVGFKREKGGAQQEIQIAEDGTVIREPAGAEQDQD